MLPFLLTLVAPAQSTHDAVRAVAGAFYAVLERFHLSRESAAAMCGWQHRQRLEECIKRGGNIARFAGLPEALRRELWQTLKPLFGYAANEADNPELEQRIAELEADRERQAREREADRHRLTELETLVRRLAQPASPQSPREERKSA